LATRHERVIVDLDDRFSRPAAGMAAGVSLFRRNVNDADRDLIKFDRTTQDVGRNIDKLSGRLGLFIDLAATLGPALIPAATAAVPLLAGLTNQLGFAVIAGGATVLAFQGVGDALKAVNEYGLDPSTANFEKMNAAMAELAPAGQDFVRQLQSMRPEMEKLQAAAQSGMFPGMTEGLESLMTRMPEAERIIGTVSDTVGDLLSQAGGSLASPEWDQFFQMLESEARPTLTALGESLGNVTRGLAEMWIAFAPLNRDFSQGMLEASESFAQWADGLSQTQGFADFMAYLEETGPQVRETLSAIGNALLDVAVAAAPIGGPVLRALEAFADVISAIASSDLGTPLLAAVAAMRAFSLASSVVGRASTTTFGSGIAGQVSALQVMPGALRKATEAQKALGVAQREARTITAGYVGQLQVANTLQAKGIPTSIRAQAKLNLALEDTRAAHARVADAEKRATSAAANRTAAIRQTAATTGKAAAGAAALGLAVSGAADSMGFANTATLGLAGSMAGPWGAAVGAGAGLLIDLSHGGDAAADALARLNFAIKAGDFAGMNAALKDFNAQLKDAKKVTGLGDAFGDLKADIGAGLKGYRSAETQALDNQAKAAGGINGAAAFAASQQIAAGFNLTASAAQNATRTVQGFGASIASMNAAIGRQSGLLGYREALLAANEALKANGRTLNKNSAEGQANRRALLNMASAAVNAARSLSPLKGARYLQNARKDFVQTATAMGMPRAEAKRLANALLAVDRTKVNPKIKVDSRQALMAANGVASALNRIPRTVQSTIRVTRTGAVGGSGAATAQAYGNLYPAQHYAYGDVANGHMPEIARGSNVYRVWAEEETKGESYIPHADDARRPRARAITEETVGILGGDPDSIEWYARGGHHKGGGKGPSEHQKALTKALQNLTKSVDKQTAARDAIAAKRSELAGNVRDKFLTDPFGESNVWAAGGGAGGAMGILKADIAKANAFKSILASLRKSGLDGDALASIASTGDLVKAQALASTGKAGVVQYESLYNERAKAANAVGSYAGTAAYSVQQAAANKLLQSTVTRLNAIEKAIKDQPKENGHHVGKALNGAAAAGKRKGGRG
jgi:hypothetical protein